MPDMYAGVCRCAPTEHVAAVRPAHNTLRTISCCAEAHRGPIHQTSSRPYMLHTTSCRCMHNTTPIWDSCHTSTAAGQRADIHPIHKGRCCSTIHWGLLTWLLPACACAIRRDEINGARQATHGPHGPAAAFCAHATLNDSTNRASGADPGLPQALRAAKGCASSSCAACSQPPLTGTRCECCRARRAAVQRLHRHIPNSMPLPCHTSLGSLVQLST
jgi:hypothetical protein